MGAWSGECRQWRFEGSFRGGDVGHFSAVLIGWTKLGSPKYFLERLHAEVKMPANLSRSCKFPRSVRKHGRSERRGDHTAEGVYAIALSKLHTNMLPQRLQINAETVGNAQSTDFPGHWPGENHEWNLEHFKEVSSSHIHPPTFS
jgi:hypothetical protein